MLIINVALMFSRSPQTRATIGGNSSPVVAPLALSVSNSGIVPLVPASDAVKENVGTAPALPSPAATLPDQPCIEADVSLTAHKATSPQQLIEFMKTVKIFIVRKLTNAFGSESFNSTFRGEESMKKKVFHVTSIA